jgi:hypothetical protein
MRSPFPGMDPYLEEDWGPVNVNLLVAIQAVLQPFLPPGLRARAEQDVFLEEPGEPTRYRSDVTVTEIGRDGFEARSASAVAEPFFLEVEHEPRPHRWVQVIDTRAGNRVVTVIELLSLKNKNAGDGNQKYRAKIEDYIDAGVNVVEIDLLRSSRARLDVTTAAIPPDRREAYCTCVHRASDARKWRVYPMSMRLPLPAIPVPCRAQDADVPLPLQAVVDRVYLEGGYDGIDYQQPLVTPLSPADAAWTAELIAAIAAKV